MSVTIFPESICTIIVPEQTWQKVLWSNVNLITLNVLIEGTIYFVGLDKDIGRQVERMPFPPTANSLVDIINTNPNLVLCFLLHMSKFHTSCLTKYSRDMTQPIQSQFICRFWKYESFCKRAVNSENRVFSIVNAHCHTMRDQDISNF